MLVRRQSAASFGAMPVCTQQQAVKSAYIHPKLPVACQGQTDSPQLGQGQNIAIHTYSDKDDAGCLNGFLYTFPLDFSKFKGKTENLKH